MVVEVAESHHVRCVPGPRDGARRVGFGMVAVSVSALVRRGWAALAALLVCLAPMQAAHAAAAAR